MTTITPTATPTTGLQSMRFVRELLTQLLDTIPEDKLTHEPFSGGNHALWIMGHMAYVNDYFLSKLTGKETVLPESWATAFGYGSEPTSDAAAYPPVTEVRSAFDEHYKRIVDWVESLDESTMNVAVPEGWESFGATNAFLPGFLAAHEALHAGQITAVRKSLGMKPVNG